MQFLFLSSYTFSAIKLYLFSIGIGNVNEVPNFFIRDKTPNISLVEEFNLSSLEAGEYRNNSLSITKFRDSDCTKEPESGIYDTSDLGTTRSLTLALERKLKTNTDLSKTSSSSRQGFKRQLIRHCTAPKACKDFMPLGTALND